MSDPRYHLTTVACRRCGEPLVQEWVAYPFEPAGPAHASCAAFATAYAAGPENFGQPAPTELVMR